MGGPLEQLAATAADGGDSFDVAARTMTAAERDEWLAVIAGTVRSVTGLPFTPAHVVRALAADGHTVSITDVRRRRDRARGRTSETRA